MKVSHYFMKNILFHKNMLLFNAGPDPDQCNQCHCNCQVLMGMHTCITVCIGQILMFLNYYAQHLPLPVRPGQKSLTRRLPIGLTLTGHCCWHNKHLITQQQPAA